MTKGRVRRAGAAAFGHAAALGCGGHLKVEQSSDGQVGASGTNPGPGPSGGGAVGWRGAGGNASGGFGFGGPSGLVPETTFELCTDGIDNDGNGFPDCIDFSCCNNPAVAVCPPC